MNITAIKIYDMAGVMALAASRALALQKEGMTMEAKGVRDVVTNADEEVEGMLSTWVERHSPCDGIVAEEGTRRPSTSGSFWYFDPIDGTKNFASGLSFFGISAGKDWDGTPSSGFLCFPGEHIYIFAERGMGAWIGQFGDDPQPMKRKEFSRPLHESIIALGLTTGTEHLYGVFKQRCWNAVVLGSFVYEAFMVFRGHYAAYIHTGATQFDCAASIVIAEELGLAVKRLDGRAVDMRETVIPIVIAQNEQILEDVLNICHEHGVN